MQDMEPAEEFGNSVSRDDCIAVVILNLGSALARLVQAASLEDEDASSAPPRRAQRDERSSSRLPALTSSDWGFEEVALPPGPRR
jgi:hypothetical protein